MSHQIYVCYKGGLTTESTHLKSGKVIHTDAPTDNHGKGASHSPTDLVCSALASCMLTVMGIYAQRENIDIDGTEAHVTKIMANAPRRISEIKIYMHIPENKVDLLTDKHKEILKRTAETCPVALSLHPEIKQILVFNF
ncbi:MAG: OsmC family protein [Cytophagaceae bacterium]|nr:OsmC family protein [Cytophagaceae bacterium]MDW8455735.1 OsmC family protein [Cytophagaceae bacterium]